VNATLDGSYASSFLVMGDNIYLATIKTYLIIVLRYIPKMGSAARVASAPHVLQEYTEAGVLCRA
jgi:hypothetical protein